MIKFMLELVYKCNGLIDLINPNDSIKMMEMSINKQDIMCNYNNICNTLFSGEVKASYYQIRQTIHSYSIDYYQG